MITRRDVLIGSATLLGTLAAGAGTALAAAPAVPLRAPTVPQPTPANGMPLPAGLVCPVPYVSRAAWSNAPGFSLLGPDAFPPEYHPVQALTVHHGGDYTQMTWEDPAGLVRAVYDYQARSPNWWGDIGYHLLIDPYGVVYEGRYSGSPYPVLSADRRAVTGAHVGRYNSGNIGICMLGHWTNGYDGTPPQAALESLVRVLAYLAALGEVDPNAWVSYRNPVPLDNGTHTTATIRGVCGHDDWPPATTCPGNLLGMLGGIRQQVAAAKPSVPPLPDPEPTSSPAPTAEPTDTGTGGDPSPTGTATDPGSPTQTQGNTATPTQSSAPPSTPPNRDRGGDEYVEVVKRQNPGGSIYEPPPPPTVLATATATPPPTYTPRPRRSTELAEPVGPGGSNWGLVAGVAGTATLVGAALGGLVWLRQRRAAAEAAGAPGLTVVDQPRVVEATVDDAAADDTATDDAAPPGGGPVGEPDTVTMPLRDPRPAEPSTPDDQVR